MYDFKYIELFCGIGGFHQAMSRIGGTCVYASDSDAKCRETYNENYGIVPDGDITKVDADSIPDHDMLCAGFPCQSFSKAGNRLGFKDKTKGTLFFDVVRILERKKPAYALLENVRNLANHDGGNTWRVIKESLDSIGYNVTENPVIFSPHYIGIPQHRERVFIMCIRKDVGTIPEFHFKESSIVPCNVESVLENDSNIKNIEKYRLTDDVIEWIDLWGEFVKGVVRVPSFPVWAEFMNPDCMSRIETVPDWVKVIVPKNYSLYNENKQFIDKWLERAKLNPNFFGAKSKFEWQAGAEADRDIWSNIMHIRPTGLRVKVGTYFPALVAITQTSIIGKWKRYITPRECARLQSFPDTFICNPSDSVAYKQFGNSVNTDVVELFARFMLGDCDVRRKYMECLQDTLF